MRLSFPPATTAQLLHVNPRSERHGPDDLVPAIDLRLQVDAANGVLSQLHETLRDSLYKEDPQGQLPGIDEVSTAGALRYPLLGQPLTWNGEATGYTLTMDYGLGGDSNISLYDCKVHKLKLTTKEGGTCTLTFTVSCAHDLAQDDVGALCMRVQHEVYIGLEPPDVQADDDTPPPEGGSPGEWAPDPDPEPDPEQEPEPQAEPA